MKKLFLFACLAGIICACQKSEDPKPVPTPTPSTPKQIVIEEQQLTADGDGGIVTLAYQTDADTVVTSVEAGCDWITVIPNNKALNKKEVKLQVSKNSSGVNRSAVVTLKAETASSTVSVIQGLCRNPYPGYDGYTLFASCDELTDEFTHTEGASILSGDQKEGTGYLSRTMAQDLEVFCFNLKNPVKFNYTDRKKAHLLFWFYIDNAASFQNGGGDIELGTTADINKQILKFPMYHSLSKKVQNGWNLVDLPLVTATQGNASEPFDPSSVQWFRLYTDANHVASKCTYGLDAVAFYESDDIYKSWFHHCDDMNCFNTPGGTTLSVDTEDAQEGTGCVKAEVQAGAVECFVITNGGNIANAWYCRRDNANLHFKLYISDITAFASGDGQIELTHSNAADVQEIHWNTSAVLAKCQDGWNDIVLKFDDADWGDNTFNPEGANFFRMYFANVNKNVTLKLDDIYIFAD